MRKSVRGQSTGTTNHQRYQSVHLPPGWRLSKYMTTATPEILLLQWGLALLSALVVGFIVGVLTFQQSKGSWPAALLAALAAAGTTLLGVHELLM